jgi:hypothetical protein
MQTSTLAHDAASGRASKMWPRSMASLCALLHRENLFCLIQRRFFRDYYNPENAQTIIATSLRISYKSCRGWVSNEFLTLLIKPDRNF